MGWAGSLGLIARGEELVEGVMGQSRVCHVDPNTALYTYRLQTPVERGGRVQDGTGPGAWERLQGPSLGNSLGLSLPMSTLPSCTAHMRASQPLAALMFSQCRVQKSVEGSMAELGQGAFPRCATRQTCGAYINLLVEVQRLLDLKRRLAAKQVG